MRRLRPRGDGGVAALEVGILATVLLLLAFGALPLYSMLRASQKVSKASSATLRYATSVASNARRTPDGALSRRPTYTEIRNFAREAAGDPTLDVTVTVCKGAACTEITDGGPGSTAPIPAVAGDTVRLTVRTTVDLRVLGSVANAAAAITGGDPVFPENDMPVTSTASAREE